MAEVHRSWIGEVPFIFDLGIGIVGLPDAASDHYSIDGVWGKIRSLSDGTATKCNPAVSLIASYSVDICLQHEDEVLVVLNDKPFIMGLQPAAKWRTQ